MDTSARIQAKGQRAGGVAALYLALALIAAMPYFLLVVDYPSARTASDKVDLILAHFPSMYAMYLVTYVVFGIALGVLALALHDKLRADSPMIARFSAATGLLWSAALVASGMVSTYGMTTVIELAKVDRAQAVTAWRAIEPVALGLGGAGGELLGGLWVLTVCWVVVRHRALPRALGWLGLLVGVVGLASVVPPLSDAAMVFGLLQIVWLTWLGLVLIMTSPSTEAASTSSAAASRQKADARPQPTFTP